MQFEKVLLQKPDDIAELSKLATIIIREHFDPLIGKEQNDYMLNMFQTVEAITKQIMQGYQYYFVCINQMRVGFFAFYPRNKELYLSKFYLEKQSRGKGYAREMFGFIVEQAKLAKLDTIVLNVNRDNFAAKVYERLGFVKIREEKNAIGHGFFMNDYVFAYKVK